VIQASGRLGNFGGGKDLKRRLLENEGVAFSSPGTVSPEFLYDADLSFNSSLTTDVGYRYV